MNKQEFVVELVVYVEATSEDAAAEAVKEELEKRKKFSLTYLVSTAYPSETL